VSTEWVPIPGYPRYCASRDGRIRSKGRHGRPRVLSTFRSWGYHRVTLFVRGDGKLVREKHFVHRLVALTFLGPPPSSEHEVSHSSGDKDDCSADNLKWLTHVENCAQKRGHGTLLEGEDHPCAKLSEDQCLSIFLRSWEDEPKRQIAEEMGVSAKTVYVVLQLGTAAARAAFWRYMEITDDPYCGVLLWRMR